MASMNIKKGDAVMVIAGKDKGKSGVVVKCVPKDGKVIVDGLNIVSKTKKARTAQERNEIRKISAPLEVSNVMPVCGECGKVTRVSHKKDEKGKSVRICKKCGATLEAVRASKAKSAAKKATKKKTTKSAEAVTVEAEKSEE